MTDQNKDFSNVEKLFIIQAVNEKCQHIANVKDLTTNDWKVYDEIRNSIINKIKNNP